MKVLDAPVRRDPGDTLRVALESKLVDRTATVAVVGLGYVGLPLLEAVTQAGFPGVGYDVDAVRIAVLTLGESYVEDVALVPTAEYSSRSSVLKKADVIVIAVPTPLTDGRPDVKYIESAGQDVAEHMKEGCLVILESTSWPGTTEDVLGRVLSTAGVPYYLGFSPERIDPARGISVNEVPKLTSGIDDDSGWLVELFYKQFIHEVIPLSGMREAEFAKLLENAFRQVNIGLANQWAQIAHVLNVDIWEALRGASTKPYGYMPFWPGPGVGGHCISVDSMFLSAWVREQLGHSPSLLDAAAEVNSKQALYVVDRIAEVLNDGGKAVKDSEVLCLGVAYKKNVGDVRESAAIKVMNELRRRGSRVCYFDPLVDDRSMDWHRVQLLTPAALRSADIVVVLTDHDIIDWDTVLQHAKKLFDTRGCLPYVQGEKVYRL